MCNMARQAAFTLLEMVLVITIIGLLAGVTAPIFSQGLIASRHTSDNLSSMGKIRYAFERMVREIRQINHNGIRYDISANTPTQIIFSKNDLTEVGIQQSGSQILLSYSTPASTQVLTDNVSAFELRYLKIDNSIADTVDAIAFVEVNLSVNNSLGGVLSQRTRIALRDKS